MAWELNTSLLSEERLTELRDSYRDQLDTLHRFLAAVEREITAREEAKAAA